MWPKIDIQPKYRIVNKWCTPNFLIQIYLNIFSGGSLLPGHTVVAYNIKWVTTSCARNFWWLKMDLTSNFDFKFRIFRNLVNISLTLFRFSVKLWPYFRYLTTFKKKVTKSFGHWTYLSMNLFPLKRLESFIALLKTFLVKVVDRWISSVF